MSPRRLSALLVLPCILAVSQVIPARADEPAPIEVTLQNHHFTPAEIRITPDTRVKLLVTNADSTPAEFESDDFSAEKVLPSGKQVKIEIGPFKAGTYEFHDEYNESEAKGKLTVAQ